MRARAALGLAVLSLTAVAVGCGGSDEGQSSGSGSASGGDSTELTKVQLILPAPDGLNVLALLMAKDRFFKEEGLDVTTEPTDGASVVVQQIVSGNAKFGTAAAAALLLGNSQGADLRGIANLTHGDTAQLTVPEESPVQSLADLKGKSVGIPGPQDGAVTIVSAALKDAGLEPGKDVKLVVVGAGGPAVVSALKSGKIDAYAGGVSDRPGIEGKGEITLRPILPDDYFGLPSTMLVVSQKTLDNPADRETAVKLARAWLKGAIFAKENPEEALEIGCKMVPQQCADKTVAELTAKLSIETTTPLDPERPGAVDPAKAETLTSALKSVITEPVSVEETLPDTYIDEIGQGL
jgi:NitT/TauT family transport system substrate-binding protein